MPEIIKTTVYGFTELSAEAQEVARDWYRQGALEYDWYEGVFDDFEAICEILGVQLKRSPVPLFGGGCARRLAYPSAASGIRGMAPALSANIPTGKAQHAS